MGLRFRRSVKLMPGLRVNLSTRGASLSVGGRGARVNFSSRGTRTTLGLPGTGISYSIHNSAGSTVRRPSAQQLAAAQRRMLQEQARTHAQAEVDRVERELSEALSCWREQLSVVAPSAFKQALVPRPFENPEVAPQAPDWAQEERALHSTTLEAVRQEQPFSKLFGALPWLIGVAVLWLASLPLGLLLAPPSGALTHVVVRRRWQRETEKLAHARATQAWPERRTQRQEEYAQAAFLYRERADKARITWDASERERVVFVQCLLRGDAESIERSVLGEIEDLDFPFEAECAVSVDEEDHVFIDVDLPEIEDVIPETRLSVLKNGSLKESKRKVSERNEAYAELVCGVALAIGAAALSAAPTLAYVTLAGRTQRQKKASVEIEDHYVFEVRLARETFDRSDIANANPLQTLQHQPSRIQVTANGSLKKIAEPAWTRLVVA